MQSVNAKKAFLLTTLLVFAPKLAMGQTHGPTAVQADAAQGFAAQGNNEPANFLVIVTNLQTGAPVTDLTQSNFAIVNHFSIPGQACGFTNNIVAFNNIGTGAYQIQVKLGNQNPNVKCFWLTGDYLAQIWVAEAGHVRGQATAKLSIH